MLFLYRAGHMAQREAGQAYLLTGCIIARVRTHRYAGGPINPQARTPNAKTLSLYSGSQRHVMHQNTVHKCRRLRKLCLWVVLACGFMNTQLFRMTLHQIAEYKKAQVIYTLAATFGLSSSLSGALRKL